MSLSPDEIAQLRKIMSITEKLLAQTAAPRNRRATAIHSVAKFTKGARRTGKELVAFRRMVRAERKRGVSVLEIARKHGITPNYVYQMT